MVHGGRGYSIGFVEITFGEAQIVDGIQQIGFPNAVGATYCHNSFMKIEGNMAVISKLSEFYVLNAKQSGKYG
jgi:hypothetical protein